MKIKKISLFTLKTATCVLLSTFALNAAGQAQDEGRITLATDDTTTRATTSPIYFQPIAPTSTGSKDLTSGDIKATDTSVAKTAEPITKSTEPVKIIVIPAG